MQKGLAAAGVAVVVAAGAGAAYYAANSSANGVSAASSNQGLGGAPGQAGGGQGLSQGGNGRGFGGPGNMGLGTAGQALHGEYVVQSNGQYVTELEQIGTITAASSSQVTVKSDDGYVQTYAISSDTTIASFAGRRQSGGGSLSASSLASGQTVRVTALKNGNAALTILVSSTAGTSGSGNSGSGTSGSSSSGQSN
ncbi:hypothetical protein [Sinomonas terrae]|uniref:DUF5666 domain-containing protein n=1 Tax=Sinomonas terrae TaxID=2908838 RepID=A0ABS9U518_9MICC|nr:hypothetical protein [Sinomonas terrae]MCH6471755.1 hypothetical protein [Sinomonas terrae]